MRVLLPEGLHSSFGPTEIKGFSDVNQQFADRDCQVLAASTDSEFVHLAWRKDHKDLRDLKFPMLADIKRDLSNALGILTDDGVAQRATFLVDPQGVIRFVYVTDGSGGSQPAGSVARARRVADRRTVSVQLEPGRRDAQGRLISGNSCSALRML